MKKLGSGGIGTRPRGIPRGIPRKLHYWSGRLKHDWTEGCWEIDALFSCGRFHTDDSMKIDDINKVTKRHMVYIWPEKGVFSYTYTWKSWHLVGFEPTLFGRAKVQPHYAYQPIAKTHMVYIWPEKGVFCDTYTWKSWHLVGFEPTLFGRAKVQPHYTYQSACQVPQVWWRHCYLSRQNDWKGTD